ncbi:antirestriction protein [Asticcacaulis sp. W401b]|uniref:antirestriction protein n=1 Tax=Asticcacaulis sp. W401b TaxID=3388666 RepID=UPI003970B995
MSDALMSYRPVATLVPEDARTGFIPKLLPGVPLLLAETYVFRFMSELSADYGGGLWAYYCASNDPLYMAPSGHEPMRVTWVDNFFDGVMSADAAGIVATLFTLSHLSFRYPSEGLSENFERLRDFSYSHAEAELIGRAID